MAVGMFRNVADRIVTCFVFFTLPTGWRVAQREEDERPSFAGTLIWDQVRNCLNEAEAAWMATALLYISLYQDSKMMIHVSISAAGSETVSRGSI